MASAEKSQAPCSPLYHANTKEDTDRAHEALAADEILWSRLAFAGIQPGINGALWEMRHCPCCGSTINRATSPKHAFGAIADHVGLVKRSMDVLRG